MSARKSFPTARMCSIAVRQILEGCSHYMYISGNMLSRFAGILLQPRYAAILYETGP